jgi:cytochrome P450
MDVQGFIDNFDHHASELAEDPWAVWDAMRAGCPVHHTDTYGGYWVVTTYEDVASVARDHKAFLSGGEGAIHIPGPGHGGLPIECDPPDHFEYRRLLNPFFTPDAVARREAQIRSLATVLVDDFIEDGRCDVHAQLAVPLPSIMTFRLLGLPEELAGNSFSGKSTEAYVQDRSREGRRQALDALIAETLEARRAEPRDDLATYLVNASIGGRPLTAGELHAMMRNVHDGGVATTADGIGNALLYLSRHPDVRRRLIDEPALMETAVEEFLRYEAPVMALGRTAAEDREIGGHWIRKGDRVLMVFGSANRDESEFEQADEVVVDRIPNRHLTFGLGIHRCIGMHLARLEMRVALEEVLRRMPDFHIDEAGVVSPGHVGEIYGRLALPMTFTPHPRLSAAAVS